MDIKDYLHFYIGCEVLHTDYTTARLIGVIEQQAHFIHNEHNQYGFCSIDSPFMGKPILRPLSDMTEEEMKELYGIVFKRSFMGNNITHRDIGKESERWVLWSGVERLFIYKDGDVGADSDLHHYHVHAPTVVRWQLSKHFDLFGLIKARLAINKELNNEQSAQECDATKAK